MYTKYQANTPGGCVNLSVTLLFVDRQKTHSEAINDHFSLLAEIDGNLAVDVGLHLSRAPFGPVRVGHQLSGLQKCVQVFHGGHSVIEAVMTQNNMDFSALVGSRICHDLISPVGAIGNGIELMGMDGSAGPELELISDSVGNANARIRFFRIAFGHASSGQLVGSNEIRSVLSDLADGTRVRHLWQVARDVERPNLRAVFQALMFMETALPFGGNVIVSEYQNLWRIEATGQKLLVDDALWGDLTRTEKRVEISPGRVQFGLLPQTLADLGRELRVHKDHDSLVISF